MCNWKAFYFSFSPLAVQGLVGKILQSTLLAAQWSTKGLIEGRIMYIKFGKLLQIPYSLSCSTVHIFFLGSR